MARIVPNHSAFWKENVTIAHATILFPPALRNYSKVSRERDPTSLSPLFIASSNRHQAETRIAKNLLTPITPAHQVNKSPLVLNSQLARHRQVPIEGAICVNSKL
jgi:hypothetical protein